MKFPTVKFCINCSWIIKKKWVDEDRSDNAPLMNVEKSTMQPFFPCSNTKKIQAGLIVYMQPDIYVLCPRLGEAWWCHRLQPYQSVMPACSPVTNQSHSMMKRATRNARDDPIVLISLHLSLIFLSINSSVGVLFRGTGLARRSPLRNLAFWEHYT